MIVRTLTTGLFLASVLFSTLSFAGIQFPTNPDPNMTPGALCTDPTIKRYAEQIDYCNRAVSTATKNAVIKSYDQQLGFQIESMNRQDFKIDHFIPLSIGGANSVLNLWPQHKSVYQYSDPLEQQLSTLMTLNKIKQAEAVNVMKECKLNLPRCADLSAYLDTLLKQ